MLFEKFFIGKAVRHHRADDELRCSFCGKTHAQVKKLIAGPTVYICNECIAICNDIIADDNLRVESTH